MKQIKYPGDVFMYLGKNYLVKETKHDQCIHCAFDNLAGHCNALDDLVGSCSSSDRADKKPVIYVELVIQTSEKSSKTNPLILMLA